MRLYLRLLRHVEIFGVEQTLRDYLPVTNETFRLRLLQHGAEAILRHGHHATGETSLTAVLADHFGNARYARLPMFLRGPSPKPGWHLARPESGILPRRDIASRRSRDELQRRLDEAEERVKELEAEVLPLQGELEKCRRHGRRLEADAQEKTEEAERWQIEAYAHMEGGIENGVCPICEAFPVGGLGGREAHMRGHHDEVNQTRRRDGEEEIVWDKEGGGLVGTPSPAVGGVVEREGEDRDGNGAGADAKQRRGSESSEDPLAGAVTPPRARGRPTHDESDESRDTATAIPEATSPARQTREGYGQEAQATRI